MRITEGMCTTDACPQRVTICVEKQDDIWIVKHINQEINVGYSCGSDVGMVLNYLKEGGQKPTNRPQVIGDIDRIKDAEF